MNRRSARKLTFTSLESLEDRIALSATAPVNALEQLVDMKAGPTLGTVYTQYVNYIQAGSQGAFVSSLANTVEEIGPTIGVNIQFGAGNMSTNVMDMEEIGMVEMTTNANGSVQGFLPIAQLPSVVSDPNVTALNPVLKPTTSATTPTSPTTPSPVTTVSLKGGPALATIYQDYLNYEAAGGTGTFSPPLAAQIEISGTAVGVDITTPVADLTAMIGAMEMYGMDVTATTTAGQVGIIEGFLPIAQLPTVASNGDLVGMIPISKPRLN